MFLDVEFQQQLRLCYADPRIWKGINVIMHETQLNRWASRKVFDKTDTGRNHCCVRIQNHGLIYGNSLKYVRHVDLISTVINHCFDVIDVMVSFIMVV